MRHKIHNCSHSSCNVSTKSGEKNALRAQTDKKVMITKARITQKLNSQLGWLGLAFPSGFTSTDTNLLRPL